MPIDPSIILGVKPVQIQQQDPLEQYGKSLSIRNLMMQGDQQQQAMNDESAVRSAYQQSGGDSATLRALLYKGGQHKAVEALDKFDLEKRAKTAEISKNEQEVLTRAVATHRDGLANVNDAQSAAQWVQAGYQDPLLAPVLSKGGSMQDALSRIPQDPAQFQAWKQQNALGAAKFIELNAPKITTQDLGGTSQVISTPGLGGTAPTVLSTTQKTQSPDSAATDVRAAKTLAESVREHNMVDTRQRELNGIMDGQSTAEPSPELVKSIARGELELPKPPTNARNPMMLDRYARLQAAVKAENPAWSNEMFSAIKKTAGSFAAGPDSKTLQSLSNATGHLDTYERLALALKNGDSQAVNTIVNSVRKQFGSSAPTNPELVSQFLAAEIVKAASGAAGGVADREHMASIFANKNSGDQMVGAADTAREIMGQQFRSLEQKYKAGTYGRTDFPDKYLTLPEVRSAYDRANKVHQTMEDAKKGQQPAAAPQSFNSLPDPAKYEGKYMTDTTSNTRYKSVGGKWVKQ